MESALYSFYSLVASYNKTHTLAKPRLFVFIPLIRACVANEIFKWSAVYAGGGGGGEGAVLGIVGGGVTFRFLNGDAITDENMPFCVRLYALVVLLKTIPYFRL